MSLTANTVSRRQGTTSINNKSCYSIDEMIDKKWKEAVHANRGRPREELRESATRPKIIHNITCPVKSSAKAMASLPLVMGVCTRSALKNRNKMGDNGDP